MRHPNDDQAVPGEYGNRWTNTYDMHLGYNAAANTMSFYDADGSRYDFVPNGSGGWAATNPGQAAYLQLAYSGDSTGTGGCMYDITTKGGVLYYFYSPAGATCVTSPGAGYFGRLAGIVGRSSNNYIELTYSWYNGDTSNPENVTQITAAHSDGQSLVLAYGVVNGHDELLSVTRPDNFQVTYGYDNNGNLIQVNRPGNPSDPVVSNVYGINSNNEISDITTPRWYQSNHIAGSPVSQGDVLYFVYGSAATSALIQEYETGFVNITPNDGTATVLQGTMPSGSAQEWREVAISGNWANGTNTTTVDDSNGHAIAYTVDANGRPTQIQQWTGANASLISSLVWDANNDVLSYIDPRNEETDFAYDANGNLIASALPSVTTSAGTFRPTTLTSYDAYNNPTASCDPVYVNQLGQNWTATPAPSDTLCPNNGATSYVAGSTGAYRAVYNYNVATEPYGQMSDIYTPMGYHASIGYGGTHGSADNGVAEKVTGDSFSESAGTSSSTVAPLYSITLDAYGDTLTANNGVGTTTMTYDSMNRPITSTDADGVTSRTCYNADGSVAVTQSAQQYALDGALCGSHSDSYTYDADGDETSETHHVDGKNDVTQKWYDGADRIVEVQEPTDPTVDSGQPGLTRYLYDLSQGVGSEEVGSSGLFVAYGNLFKTQRCWSAEAGTGTCLWNDVRGNSFDAANRPTARYQHTPFGPVEMWATAYDQNGFAGLPTSTTDPLEVTTSVDYDAQSRVQSETSSDGSFRVNYIYDADGRVATASNPTDGPDTYVYDADGRKTSFQEGTNYNTDAALTYAYYPNGWRKSLSISTVQNNTTEAAPVLPYNTYQYMYRADGARTVLALAGVTNPFAWTYSVAGRMTSQSDPYTGDALPLNTILEPTTFSYDAYGQPATMTLPLPNQLTISSILHNAGGNVTTLARQGIGQYASYTFNARNELASTQIGSASIAKTSYWYDAICPGGYCTDFVPDTDQVGGFDPYTGVSKTTNGFTYSASCAESTSSGYDLAGRYTAMTGPAACMAGQEQLVYDSQNHITSDTTCGANMSCTINNYGWGPSGKLRFFTNDVTGPGTGTQCSVSFGVCTMNQFMLHWDGDSLLYVTDSSGRLAQQNVEQLGSIATESVQGVAIASPSLTVSDRDFTGTEASEHNAAGTLATSGIAPGLPGVGTAPTPGLFGMYRDDGYTLGNFSMQGVRMYDQDLGFWTTPDSDPGNLDEPMTQRPYLWLNNNPMDFSDTSGNDAYDCGGSTSVDGGKTWTHFSWDCSDASQGGGTATGGGPFNVLGGFLPHTVSKHYKLHTPCNSSASQTMGEVDSAFWTRNRHSLCDEFADYAAFLVG